MAAVNGRAEPDPAEQEEIDPADKFHNGPEFANYFEMRDLIADREEDFAVSEFVHALVQSGVFKKK